MGCPVARAVFITGDAWIQLIVREAFFGARRYAEWQKRLKVPKSVLARRLATLLKARVFELRSVAAGHEYHLTEMGRDLYGFAIMQGQWEGLHARRDAPSPYPLRLFDRTTGVEVVPVVLDRAHGNPIDMTRVGYEVGPGLKPIPKPTSRRRRVQTVGSHERSMEHSVSIMGDYWSWALLSAAFFRVRRFDELTESLGIATNVLAERLQRLVDEGVLERRIYNEARARAEYRLTDAGKALYPTVLALHGWSERWLCDFDNPPLKLIDRTTGKRITPVVADRATGVPLDAHKVYWKPSSEAATEATQVAGRAASGS